MTAAPETLPEVALAFARECLGWEIAVPRRDGIFKGMGGGITGMPFCYTDLNAVMEAARGWCDKTMSGLSLEYMPGQQGFGAYYEGNDTWDRNPCHTIMAACVAAARKLKTA